MNQDQRRSTMRGRAGWWGAAVVVVALGLAPRPEGPAAPRRPEVLARPDGGSAAGRIAGDAGAGFRFEAAGGATSPLAVGDLVTWDGGATDPTVAVPPFRVELGLDQRVSGRLGRADAAAIALEGGPGGASVAIDRRGASALAQRAGEALVLRDGWETLDPDRWAVIGDPEVAEHPHLEGTRALVLPARGAAITHIPPQPVASGRLEVAFHDPGGIAPGHQWFVDLLFRGPLGPETVRVVLDLGEEGLGVQSSGGPALAVQRLARKPGWHRLGVRFGPETELVVDGDELARGRETGGPLAEVRLAHQTAGGVPGPGETDLAVAFDDLRLVRLAEAVGSLEVAPHLDDARLVDGDQIFGTFRAADADGVRLGVDGRDVPLPWTDVAAVRFRREASQGRPIDGLLVRVEWRPGAGLDARDLDQAEGALVAATDAALTVATPHAGELVIPRDRLRRLKVVGRGTRIVVDPHAHHLGNNIAPTLDPPLHEGGTLDRALNLATAPDPTRPAALVLDVVEVVGEETGDPFFAALVRKGQLRTTVRVNGVVVDYLNRHITTKNETPERIRLPIPAGLLRPGSNTIRFEQGSRQEDPDELDDLGILTIAVEFAPR